jgi:hypothetical protein
VKSAESSNAPIDLQNFIGLDVLRHS